MTHCRKCGCGNKAHPMYKSSTVRSRRNSVQMREEELLTENSMEDEIQGSRSNRFPDVVALRKEVKRPLC